jgi:hypothetical protein
MRKRYNLVSILLGSFLFVVCCVTPLQLRAGDAVGYDWDEGMFRYCWSPDPPGSPRYSTAADCIAQVQRAFGDTDHNYTILYDSDRTHFVAFAGGDDQDGREQIAIGSGSTQYDAQQDAYRQLRELRVDYFTLYGSYFSNGLSGVPSDSPR